MGNYDQYYPFNSGAGAAATQARWEKYAKSIQDSGVLRNLPNYHRPSVIDSTHIGIDTGAVWLDGAYGETTTLQSILLPSSSASGIIVAQADFVNNLCKIVYNDGVFIPVQTTNSIWEILLVRMAAGVMYDCRTILHPVGPIGHQVFS